MAPFRVLWSPPLGPTHASNTFAFSAIDNKLFSRPLETSFSLGCSPWWSTPTILRTTAAQLISQPIEQGPSRQLEAGNGHQPPHSFVLEELLHLSTINGKALALFSPVPRGESASLAVFQLSEYSRQKSVIFMFMLLVYVKPMLTSYCNLLPPP